MVGEKADLEGSKVYDSPDLAENEATFAIGPQGVMNADG